MDRLGSSVLLVLVIVLFGFALIFISKWLPYFLPSFVFFLGFDFRFSLFNVICLLGLLACVCCAEKYARITTAVVEVAVVVSRAMA